MRAQLLLDVAPKTGFCLKLNGLEVLDILRVEEHIPDRRFLFVHA
jgi:hypothetical protein